MLQDVRRHLFRTRRRLTRHRRALASLFAAGAVGAGLLVVSPPPPAATDVVVASRDLRGGATLTTGDLTVVSMPQDLRPGGATATASDLVGRLLAGPVRAGEPVTDARVLGDTLLAGYGPGRVAIPVRMADAAAVRLLRAGDRIDVLAADPAAGEAAVVVAAAVPVVTVPAIPDGAGEPAGGLVLLAVGDDTARKISAASVVGPVSFVLRE